MPPKGKFMDVLEAVSDDSSDEGSQDSKQEGSKRPRKAAEVTIEDLQRAGYKSGPSVLLVRPPTEQVENNWNWSSGRESKAQEQEETYEERLATRQIASEGAETTAKLAVAATEHAEWLRGERRAEREAAAAERRQQSFNAKEKRKRDEGKTSRGKSYVEEEKRLQRSFGVYSGFDT